MTTPWTTSAGMMERARTYAQHYEDLPTWELERHEATAFEWHFPIPEGLTKELHKRRAEVRINNNWSALEREGFGM